MATQAELKRVNQELLDFDHDNPRFGGLLKKKSNPEIQKALMESPYYASELIDSLLKNGFIDYEPLVVKVKQDRYTVVEGNRRLAAIREILSDPVKYVGNTKDLLKIPVLVFPDQPDEQQKNEMRVYLGVRHLMGIREWPPLSKAIFLEMASKDEGGLDRVFKETQLKKTDARRFLVPYRLLKASKADIGKADFWVLGEALSRSEIKTHLQLDVDKDLQIESYHKTNLKALLNDLYGPLKDGKRDSTKRRVDDTRDLSRLGKVLSSEKATTAFRSGKTLDEAEIYVDTREESLQRLKKTTKSLGVLIRKKIAKDWKGKSFDNLGNAFTKFESAVESLKNSED